jgi:RES domain
VAIVVTTPEGPVFRIGYPPDAWAWVPWQYGPFTGRWDDPQELYRTLYAGSSPLACFVEVLAQFRPDGGLTHDLGAIRGDARDRDYPSVRPGELSVDWLARRRLGRARLSGAYVDIGHSRTVATLRGAFLQEALSLGLPDFDAAAIRLHAPRRFTQEISRCLSRLPIDGGVLASGVAFSSRHGDELRLWAVFEREADVGKKRSHLLTSCRTRPIDPEDKALLQALEVHGLILVRRVSG